jgi:hypothetical protein
MSDKARFESHAINLGKLVGNLQSLEMMARMVIVRLDQRAAERVRTQLPQVRAGDLVEINAFTNGDDLTQTLEKYNKRTTPGCRLDVARIVGLRDALAHGRTFGIGSMKHLRLLKFSRRATANDTTANEEVRVELAEDMTPEWFLNNIRILNDAIDRITEALEYEKREFV